ncbi:MAG: glutamate synthase large subunit, partial [Lentisphaerae bacterium]
AAGSDETTGDGGGILFQIPHEFFAGIAQELSMNLPEQGAYGVGQLFLPKDPTLNSRCKAEVEAILSRMDFPVLGWRQVPGNPDCLGDIARQAEPEVWQVFIDAGALRGDVLERRLYLARKRIEHAINAWEDEEAEDFYICSMSARTICYKGMFLAPQLFQYYPDLHDARMKSALAVVHQRYSTNTFPSWKLAQPFRFLAHNGEINTLHGNINKIKAAEKIFESDLFGDEIKDLIPVLEPGQSDSASFDNVVELLVMTGRSLPHSIMMMIPEAFGPRYHMSTDKRAFYEYHAALMAPWDGPAAMVFTDGRFVGGTLDRNGLRPCRYLETNDGLVVLASETGVIDVPPEQVLRKGRLQPGKMFLVDTEEGRIITDNEIKARIARQRPYRRWLEENRIELKGIIGPAKVFAYTDEDEFFQKLRAFGYTRDEIKVIIEPMARNGQEPVGSMGNDTPLAVLSNKPKHLFQYFKQLFAQVTNPPIDPLREGLVMSLMGFGGRKGNLLTESPEHCRQLKLPHPILTNEEVRYLREEAGDLIKTETLSALFPANGKEPGNDLKSALDDLVKRAIQAVKDGAELIIISDRGIDKDWAGIPILMAVGAVHHGLIRAGLRTLTDIIAETAEVREVQHFCLMGGFGAFAVNPYMVFDILRYMFEKKEFPENWKYTDVVEHYINAIKKGILKTISKMGISTFRSYREAQLFECIGLNREVVDFCFTGATSRIQGAGFGEIAEETLRRHREAFRELEPGNLKLDFSGEYAYRDDGERHGWTPETIALLQRAVRYKDDKAWEEFTNKVNDQSRELKTLRGLFEFKSNRPSVPLEEVEPASEIVKRFCTGAMSHGSISKEAHETMAAAMNAIGGMNNTGEGGEDPIRYRGPVDGWDLNSAIKQVASGRFGVTIEYLAHAKELQIKMAQGAKPGEGGQLPGHKVTEEIARLRHSTPGVTLISPPPHHDIYSIEDLAQLIYDLKCSNPGVKVSVKLVSEVGVGTIAAGVAKGNADEVLISGHDGGTGASPLSSIKHAGCPWELGLAETQQTLIANGLRDRIRVQTDGQMRTGRDVVIAALLGAEQFGFGTAALVSLGCIMMRKCHLGMCPVGVATQTPELRKRFKGNPEFLINYMMYIAEDVRKLMAQLGFRKMEEMIGQVECLDMRKAIDHYKARNLDLSPIFYLPEEAKHEPRHKVRMQTDPLPGHKDWQILELLGERFEKGEPVTLDLDIDNTNRTVGAILSNRLVKKFGASGLPEDTIRLRFKGSAGQSFGAFLAPGITLELEGDANDYLGKGLSGGKIIVKTPANASYVPHENIIVGNTLLYGATSGEVFINGLAGERFAVRNSGAKAVVEGVGDHGCEYMTGGVVVVLGETGVNFAAGMSGGIAFVLDEHQLFDTRCNLDMVDLESVWHQEDKDLLHNLISKHLEATGSKRAKYILDNWRHMLGCFVKVMPIDYRKALERIKQENTKNSDTIPATEEVYR